MASFLVDRFRVTLMGANADIGELIGWIELLNGTTPTGYIYLHNRADNVKLPADNESSGGTYVVMHQRTKYLDAILTVLKGPKKLTISFSNGLALLQSPVTTSLAADEAQIDAPADLDANAFQDIARSLISEASGISSH